jgi:hypothetical protein
MADHRTSISDLQPAVQNWMSQGSHEISLISVLSFVIYWLSSRADVVGWMAWTSQKTPWSPTIHYMSHSVQCLIYNLSLRKSYMPPPPCKFGYLVLPFT